MLKHSSLIATGAIAVFCLAAPALGQWPEIDRLLASDGATGDAFGASVSISGDTAVVGAYYDDDNGDGSGSAYVFRDSGPGWVQVAKLLASDGAEDDWFGHSVSISGDTVVVGASSSGPYVTIPGSAYVFERPAGGWSGTLNEDAKLLASDGAAEDYFGSSVSISGRHDLWSERLGMTTTAAVPARRTYSRNRSGAGSGTLNQDAKLLASDGEEGDWFGDSLSIFGDTVVVGARWDDDNGNASGSAYVFEKPVGGWSGTLNQGAKLLPSDNVRFWFGASVSISGDTVVIGAETDDDNGSASGSAYVFERPVGGWFGTLNEDAKLLASDGAANDRFGGSVCISGDTMVVGASGDDDNGSASGSAYVFERPGRWLVWNAQRGRQAACQRRARRMTASAAPCASPAIRWWSERPATTTTAALPGRRTYSCTHGSAT